MPLNEKIPNQLLHVAFITAEDIVGKNGLITFAKVSKSHGGRASAAEILAALGR